MSNDRVKISVEPGFVQPTEAGLPRGERRLVRYLPIGIPGSKALMRPCIWMSPYEVFDEDLNENIRVCILLLNEGPPRPDIVAIRIPSSAIEKFPEGPVAW